MKKTYKFNLPQNKEVAKTNIRVENGEILVDVEFEDKFEPKDGDFVVSSYRCVFIYSSNIASDEYTYSSYCGEYRGGCGISTTFSNNWTKREGCRYATEAEKSAFLDRLEKEYHKRWNEKTKELEDIRWRAEAFEDYYYVDMYGRICHRRDSRDEYANALYDTCNYFRILEAAQKVADQIKEIFKNSKSE